MTELGSAMESLPYWVDGLIILLLVVLVVYVVYTALQVLLVLGAFCMVFLLAVSGLLGQFGAWLMNKVWRINEHYDKYNDKHDDKETK